MRELEPVVCVLDDDPSIRDHLRDLARSVRPGVETFAAALGTRGIATTLHRGQVMRKMRAESSSDLVQMAENWATPPPGMSPPIPRYNRFPASHAVFFLKKRNSPEKHTRLVSTLSHAVTVNRKAVVRRRVETLCCTRDDGLERFSS
jgi:hypothetical protein